MKPFYASGTPDRDALQKRIADFFETQRQTDAVLKALQFIEDILNEQIAHGEHGDAEYIRRASDILAAFRDDK